ncbi:hypothetical protein NQ314_019081 [Rhamnusium bicolor]|uniref:RAD50-interacting protein 1 n=1 Tax=Rhamnusium bicolor TaxID=1586634 RepID=A0AAV8WPG1_9CUCU|nr:hypothetical protein NQ314_019081 [Rhamnusium bicolor]
MVSCSSEVKRKIIKELNEKHEKSVETAEDVVKRAREIIGHIEKDLADVDEVRKEVREHFEKLNVLQCTLQYLKVIQQIEYLSVELQREVSKKEDEKCATLFANLTEISRNLADFSAVHLRTYLKETIHHWHNILKEKLAKDLDEVLKAIKWPFVSTNFSLVVPLPTQIQKLQIISEYLLQIEIPSESSIPVVTSALLSDFPHLCLPIHFLVQPLRKDLYTIFMVQDKPIGLINQNAMQRYFTQILTWVRDHRDFVGKYVQPVIDKLGLHHIDAKLELIRGLVQLAVEKLYSELPNLQYDDFTFSHSIDEALGFDKELRETYDYPSNQPSILAVLTQAQVFVKWLAMEKKYAIEKMDSMLPPNSVEAFEPLTSDVEDLKITTCADAFITLLQTITERYESLPQPGHRLQFLELQLELLDDFRVRLLQLVNAEHYLNLYYYKSQLEIARQPVTPTLTDFDESPTSDIETDTVFAETLSLYRHMRRDLLNILAETVTIEIKQSSKVYRRERWSSMKVEKEFRSLFLTPSACPMFEILSKRLHQLQKSLHSRLFTFVWRSIAQQLDTYLFEDLVLDNRFSEGGALQLKFDVTRNLIPLFAQFSERPNNYFTQLIESCNLLNVSKGSALLLRETILALEGATGVEDTRGKALKEIGVNNFTPKMAVKILNQRTDITINRISID